MSKVLIADDQVPKSDLGSEDEVRRHYLGEHKDPDFAEGFVFLYKMIRTLKTQGFEVDGANRPSDVLKALETGQYDVIVLDLGWWTAKDRPYDDRMVLGWDIAKQIREHSSAPIVMFSNRFFEDQELARTAAEKGLLPVYKSYDDACIKHIVVTIRFAVMARPFKVGLIDDQKLFAFKMYRRLSTVLLGAIIASVALLLASVTFAVVKGGSTASIVSSAFGFVLTFLNGVVFRYVKQYKSDLM
jgi:CheY-like chemotaxis protein